VTKPVTNPVRFTAKAREDYLAALRQGLRPGQAAHNAGVSRWTVHNFRLGNPDFVDDERDAILDSVEMVEDALFKAAIGGNVTACQVWLYNRAPEQWRDMRARDAVAAGYSGAVTIDDEVLAVAAQIVEAEAARATRDASG
jgi:ribosomal protein S18 acetylase RimI-like enzyme